MIKTHTKGTSEFIPKNATKYCGKYPILVRSSWERMFFQWVDVNPNVVKWASENIAIPYIDPIRHYRRRYYPDVYMKVKTKNGFEEFVVEIKPEKETRPPKKTGRKSQKTQHFQEMTYLRNIAKWKAATEYCRKMKMQFKLITEKQLFNK